MMINSSEEFGVEEIQRKSSANSSNSHSESHQHIIQDDGCSTIQRCTHARSSAVPRASPYFGSRHLEGGEAVVGVVEETEKVRMLDV